MTAIRASLLTSSFLYVRQAGLEEPYFERLPTEHHEAMLTFTPSSWVPIEIGEAHYEALNGVIATTDAQRRAGRAVAARVQNAVVASVVRSLRATGTLTMTTLVSRFPTFWRRLLMGGDCGVFQVGPKDIRLECHGTRLLAFAYVREGWAGMFEQALSIAARRLYVREIPDFRSRTTAAFLLSWV